MAAMGTNDLLDQLDALLPRVQPAEEARQVVAVMARICGAASAAVLFDSGDALRWLAGDPLSDEVGTAIQRAWRLQSARVLTGTAFTEMREGMKPGSICSRLMWMRRPADGGLDAVYFAGRGMRPIEACSAQLLRLAALLGRLYSGGNEELGEGFTKIGYA